jgi:hypothetical protein
MKNVIKYSLVATAIALSFNASAQQVPINGGNSNIGDKVTVVNPAPIVGGKPVIDDSNPTLRRDIDTEIGRAKAAESAITIESRQIGAMALSAAAAAANSTPTAGKRSAVSGAE